MTKKLRLFFLITLIMLFISCQKETLNEKRTRFFKSYLTETFPNYKLNDGEFLLILPGGCSPCKKTMLLILNNHVSIVNNHVNSVLLSINTKLLYREINFSKFKNVLIDNSNKLDKIALGIYEISLLKIENGTILGIKSFTADDYKKGFQYFLDKPYK